MLLNFDPFKRKKMVQSLPNHTCFTTIIHPTAIISNWVEIGEGGIIGPYAVLTTDIKIGRHAIVNYGVTIGHDCSIDNFFTAAPAVNISGNCKFNECVYLGTNSSVKENISIQNLKPVANCVLSCNNYKQAIARTKGSKNRAAEAVGAIISVLDNI